MDPEERIRLYVLAFTAIIAMAVGGWYGVRVFGAATPQILGPVIAQHFAAVAMAPLIAMTSLLGVMIFRASGGPVEFEALGFKFHGSSGQTVMFIACVLALTVSVKLLWVWNSP